ncbi:unnamed protein product [Effrenium voratum]|uniref:Methyltransferase type 11 domain-containing protein n=1 Tax=Effrenium voratum TaxID=2562239 RepID=A0AA36N0I3_9DINO|nr:unnamed protein product [Effrenium voratum]
MARTLLASLGATHVPGQVQVLVNQSVLPLTMLLSLCCLGRRYGARQLLGAGLVLAGAGCAIHWDAKMKAQELLWKSLLTFCLAQVVVATSTLVKEALLQKSDNLAETMSLGVAIAWRRVPLGVALALLPRPNPGTASRGLFTDFADGFRCFCGQQPREGDLGCPLAMRTTLISVALYATQTFLCLRLTQKQGATIRSIAAVTAVPLAQLLFSREGIDGPLVSESNVLALDIRRKALGVRSLLGSVPGVLGGLGNGGRLGGNAGKERVGGFLHGIATRLLAVSAGAEQIFLNESSGVWQVSSSKSGLLGLAGTVKGAGGFTHIAAARSSGAEALRTWGLDQLNATIEEAEALGMKISAGIWLTHDREHYQNCSNISEDPYWQTELARIVEGVAAFKRLGPAIWAIGDSPAILWWTIGNEIEFATNVVKGSECTWRILNWLIQGVKAEDPNHPVGYVSAGTHAEKVQLIAQYVTELDFLGVNSYGEDSLKVGKDLQENGVDLPYALMEFGPTGHWAANVTAWGSYIEESSTEKVPRYVATCEPGAQAALARCEGVAVLCSRRWAEAAEGGARGAKGQEHIWLKLTQGMAAIDWSDPERLKSLEKRYSLPDIVEQRRRFIELAKPLEGESCLDVGCGPAFLVELLKAAVGEKGSVVGVDHSEAMVQAAKVRCPSAKVLQASAEELPFPDGSFDLVTITQVVVYVADPAKALSEVKRVLKLGGRVLILDSIWSQSSWSGADVELQRRILDAYDKHCSHPLLPMRIPELLGRVGLEFADGPHVIPITNIAWDEVGFAKGASANIVKYVTEQSLIEKNDTERWLSELEDAGRNGTFFFNLNRYVFAGIKKGKGLAGGASKRQRME